MFASDRDFEGEVRRIARLLWPSAEFGGASIEEGRERDGVFETEEFVHILECTTSRSKRKADEDLDKLQKLVRKLGARYPQKFVKGWFVTLQEPTADQRAVFRKVQGRIVAVSFDQFRSRLVDAKSYLSARENYPFGSVRDPETGVARIALDYVPLDIVDKNGSLLSVDDICSALLKGQKYVLVGFQRPSDLVRGWRAGLALPLLDGFDEIATAGWAGKMKKLRDLRFRSMELVRAFLRDTPPSFGVLLAGRAYFFDSVREMAISLNLGESFSFLNVSEFERLPGLGGHSSEGGARVFIDEDFAEAARGSTIADFIDNPYGQLLESEAWQSSLWSLGAEVAACKCYSAGIKQGKIEAALRRVHELPKSERLCADIVLTLFHAGASCDSTDIFVKEVLIPEILLEGFAGSLARVQFQDCIVGRLDLPADTSVALLPSFVRCHFGSVDGRTGLSDMPPQQFLDCTFDTSENPAQTTNAILALGLPLGTKVLLTILKKLFAQRGSGRRESAFYRGLDARGRELVPEALGLLSRHAFASRDRQAAQVVWLPSKPSEVLYS